MTAAWRGRDAQRAVERAVLADAAAHGLNPRLVSACGTPWASATFSGTRHVLDLACTGAAPAIAGWAARLAEAELPLAHHVAADAIARIAGAGRVTIEILTVAKA